MSTRSRDLSRHKSRKKYVHKTIEKMLSKPLKNGVHSLQINDRWFDFLYEDRGSPVTLITFSAALHSSNKTYPVFSSRLISENLGANFLGFADPAQGGNESLSTYWHLSTERVATQSLVPQVIKHATAHSGKNLLFFGSSAGGFAALNYSAMFPKSAVLVMNPRVNLSHSPYRIPDYSKVAHPNTSWAKLSTQLPLNLAKQYEQPQGNFVVYLQNLQDENYVRHHYSHFVKAVNGRADVRFVTKNWGAGHVVPPQHEFVGRLKALIASAPNWNAKPIPKVAPTKDAATPPAGKFKMLWKELGIGEELRKIIK